MSPARFEWFCQSQLLMYVLNVKGKQDRNKKYFQGVAKFDEGIAQNDAIFIKTQLEKYEKNMTTVQTELMDDFNTGLKHMKIILGLKLYEKIGKLLAVLAVNTNPLKLITSGPDLAEAADRTGDVASTASQLDKSIRLINEVQELSVNSKKLVSEFVSNAEQIKNISSLVDKIKNGTMDDIDKDADLFLQQYGNYTPIVDRATLTANHALWSAFKEAMCNILTEDASGVRVNCKIHCK